MKADQERVKNLLIDTVTLLCKNSLTYQDELCIEGLLGVKVDQKNVFFVHISQTFQSELPISLSSNNTCRPSEQLPETETPTQGFHHNEQASEHIRVKREQNDDSQAANFVSRTGPHSPRTRDPSAVGAHRAEIVAGQRRVHSQHSHHRQGQRTSSSTGGSPRALTGEGVSNSPISELMSEQLTSAENHHESDSELFSEPPTKRRVKDEVYDEDGSSLLGADGMDDVSPWPNIGGQTAGSLGMMAAQVAQSMARNFEGNQSPSNDAGQPGCSAWPFPSGLVPPSPTDMAMAPSALAAAAARGYPDVAKMAALSPDSILPYHSRRPSQQASHQGGSTGSKKPKKYMCTDCDKGFVSMTDLERHTRTHTGERPFKCEVCGAAFALESNLKKHTRVHTQEKPYDCRICGRVFGYTNTLIQHLRTVHNLKDV